MPEIPESTEGQPSSGSFVNKVASGLREIYGFETVAGTAEEMAETFRHSNKVVELVVRGSAKITEYQLKMVDRALDLAQDLNELAEDIFGEDRK